MFEDKERKVFKYHNGEKEVYADPLAIARRLRVLMGGETRQNEIITALKSKDFTHADSVIDEFNIAVAKAFEIKKLFDPNTGEGFREESLEQLWNLFNRWVAEKKNRDENSPTTSPPSAATGLPRFPGQ